MINQKELKELFRYDNNSGNLIRLKKIGASKPIGTTLGSIDGKGYLNCQLFKIQYKVHRLIWLYHYGEFPNENIDHIDGNRINNRIENLREASLQENVKNLSIDKRNKTGVTGVIKSRWANSFEASISVNKKQIHLGTFRTLNEAIIARKNAENKYGYHENHGKKK